MKYILSFLVFQMIDTQTKSKTSYKVTYVGVLDDFNDVLWVVDLVGRVGAVVGHLGLAHGVQREGGGIGDVPVEAVQLVVGHGVHQAHQVLLGVELAGGVQHQTTVSETRDGN